MASKKLTHAKFKGTYPYWERCVRRINVFCDTSLKAGKVECGQIAQHDRELIGFFFNRFMEKYEGVVGDRRPFNEAQEAEIKRVIDGGYFLGGFCEINV